MATTNYTVTNTAWVEVSTTNNILVNNSSYSLRVRYASSLPALSETNYSLIPEGRGIVKANNMPEGNTYVLCDEEEVNAIVSVSE